MAIDIQGRKIVKVRIAATGIVYGFNGSKLVTYDRTTGIIDDVTFPVSTTADGVGALYFDAFGNLKGYGRAIGTSTQQDFFNIDKNTGLITSVATGPTATQNDGCSCPYTIEAQKIAQQSTVEQCGSVIFDIIVANESGNTISGVDLQDIAPNGFTFQQIITNPFGGTVTGLGTGTLDITNMTIPLGSSTLQVELSVANNLLGTYLHQTTLNNLPATLGSTVQSDYPTSVQQRDPTPVTVVPHNMQVQALGDTTICSGGSALLSATITNGGTAPFSYAWSPTASFNNANQQSPTANSVLQTSTFSVTATDSEGCSASDDIPGRKAGKDVGADAFDKAKTQLLHSEMTL